MVYSKSSHIFNVIPVRDCEKNPVTQLMNAIKQLINAGIIDAILHERVRFILLEYQ